MTKKVISYKLNTDGTVPDFVEEGGYLAKDANNTPNMIVFGISKDGSDISGAEAEFTTETDVLSFVSTYLSDTTITDPSGFTREFVVADAVAELFAKLA